MYRSLLLIAVVVLLPGCGTAPTTASTAEVSLANGERALENGSYEAAIGWLSSAITADGNNAAAYRLRAKAYCRKAEGAPKLQGMAAAKAAETPAQVFDQAVADATRAIELDPRDAEAYLVRAQAQHRKGGDKAKELALADCDKALELAAQGPVAAEAKKLRDAIRGG
jgi:tetratricopeptide (TPR) repeat protein